MMRPTTSLKTNSITTYVSEMTEGQTFGHAGSCDKAEDCCSGIGMTPDRHLPVTMGKMH
jgi:hypothetical protein